MDRCYSNISRDFVAHSHFDDVTRNELARFDALDLTRSILSNDFGDFGLVFFESFDGTLCIAFLGVEERSLWMRRGAHEEGDLPARHRLWRWR